MPVLRFGIEHPGSDECIPATADIDLSQFSAGDYAESINDVICEAIDEAIKDCYAVYFNRGEVEMAIKEYILDDQKKKLGLV